MVRSTIDREEVHTIMVRTNLLELLGAGIHTVIAVSRETAQNGRAPRNQRRPLIAFRQSDGVSTGNRDGVKSNARHRQVLAGITRAGITTAAAQARAKESDSCGTQRALQNSAAGKTGLNNIGHMGIGRQIGQRLTATINQLLINVFLNSHDVSSEQASMLKWRHNGVMRG